MLIQSFVINAAGQTLSPKVKNVSPLPLIMDRIDESHLTPMHGTMVPRAKQATDAGIAPDSLSLGRTILLLARSDQQQQALDRVLSDQQNAKSPNYHKWLTPEEFGSKFGASPQDMQKITQWLQRQGFQVEPPMAGNNTIIFTGTHAQLKSAFHTELHQYVLKGQTFYANASDPQIPAALAPAIRGFVSLNNFPRRALHSNPKMIKRVDGAWKSASPQATGASPNLTISENGDTLFAIAPYDLATIYNVLPLWNAGIDGTGQTIAIVSPSDINPADVDAFRSMFGLPAKKLNLIYYGPNPGKGAAEAEADLDVEWAGSVAKNATIDLVVAANTATSGGIDGAAAYIVNNNLASIMNVSYGECEYELGPTGNAFYSEIWQQAAAQGITVFVAAGDSGSASCDDQQEFAQNGISVSGIASTPYDVAVGGTDLYGNYLNASKYWSGTNNSTTLASALSYIPEIPWNNSCASPQILSALQAQGIADSTPEALCNDFSVSFQTTAAGSGGASRCITSGTTGIASCASGYAKPSWQNNVAGIPNDGVRDLPDVSLMAGNGVWGSFYLYCQSDATVSGTCDVNTQIEGAGGTSFASPIFAGILALVQQKTQSAQGNANYIFYKLASSEFPPTGVGSNCATENATSSSGCIFYDVTQGTNAVPCLIGSPDCTVSNPADFVGVLPSYNAGAGYDLTTGLGSVNVANLVNNWGSEASSFLPTTVSLKSTTGTQLPYGTPLNLSVNAAPAAGSNTSVAPEGYVGITSNDSVVNNVSVGEITLSAGAGSASFNTLGTGTYQLFAHYAGDTTFAPSDSTGLTITITPGSSTPSISAGHPTLTEDQVSGVAILISGIPTGVAPTGTVDIVNTTTGVALGSFSLTPQGSFGSSPSASAYVSVAPKQLQFGSNTIAASYSGDAYYAPIKAFSTTIQLVAAYTVSTNPASLILAPSGSGAATVIVTPTGTAALNPAGFSFSCPANLPVGLACSFSAPTNGSNGTVISVLTVQASSPFMAEYAPPATKRVGVRNEILELAGCAFLSGLAILGLPFRRRSSLPFLAVAIIVSCSLLNGCGNSSPSQIQTTTALSVTPKSPGFQSSVTFTTQVTPSSSAGTPTGVVTYSNSNGTLGSASLSGGVASLALSTLPVGGETVVATYSGDSKYAPSASAPQSLDIAYGTVLTITAVDKSGATASTGLNVTIQ